jgi:competence protein ComEC
MAPSLFIGGAALLVGMLCALQYGAGVPLGGLVLLIGLASFAILARDRRRSAIILLVATGAFLVGITRVHFLAPVHREALDQVVGKVVEMNGTIVAEPDWREDTTRITVAVSDFAPKSTSPIPIDPPARVLVSTFPHLPFSYGDIIHATGTLRYPTSFTTDNGRTFEYPGYLEAQRIGYQMSRASVTVAEHAGLSLRGILFFLKQWFVTGLRRSLEEPASGLAAGIMVGDKRSLGDELTQAFRTSGLIHVVVLSGYHITIVGVVLLSLFSFLPRMARFSASFVGIVLFIMMTGSSTTAIRAGVMGSIALLARGARQQYDALRALLVAVVGMALFQPLILEYDPGFQMSVAATAGIILLTPRIVARLPNSLPLIHRELIGATAGAQIMVAPLIAYHMGTVSLVALIANLIVLPVVPFAMLLSLGAGVMGALVPLSLAPLVGFPAFLILEFVVSVASVASSVPFASIAIPIIPGWVIAVMYMVGGFWLWVSRPVPERK